MFPKVGDVVRLNPNFLKAMINRGSEYFKKEKWEGNLKIIEIQEKQEKFIVIFESKDYRNSLYITSNGELSTWCEELKGVQVFIPANLENNNDIYCSCNGPKKENWVFGERFYICTTCKKEVV